MKTTIMCTLTVGQIMDDCELVKAMYHAGMREVRINTAHLSGVDQLGTLASRLKQLLPGVRILIDTKGPEMRTTSTLGDAEIMLEPGMKVTIEGDSTDRPTTPELISVNYPLIHTEVHPGHELLIDDGHIAMVVDSVKGTKIEASVTRGGALGSRKGISVTGVDVNLPAVSERDRMYISYASKSADVDMIAHSFVRSAADVEAVKSAMGDSAKPIIAKIENQQGINNIAEIIAASDGILIARGDLTASIGAENVPQAQALIAHATKETSMPLYLATNILPSMMAGTTPSETDVEGISLAIGQGVDVMLLTNETASGAHPLQSVEVLSAAISHKA